MTFPVTAVKYTFTANALRIVTRLSSLHNTVVNNRQTSSLILFPTGDIFFYSIFAYSVVIRLGKGFRYSASQNLGM